MEADTQRQQLGKPAHRPNDSRAEAVWFVDACVRPRSHSFAPVYHECGLIRGLCGRQCHTSVPTSRQHVLAVWGETHARTEHSVRLVPRAENGQV